MTIEEAIELVLAGIKWVMCPLCSGFGVVTATGGRATPACMPCRGLGTVIAADYANACKVLGKELPTAKPSIRIMSQGSATLSDGAVHNLPGHIFELPDDT